MTSDLTSISSFQAHENRVWNISWSPDGKFIASCGEDRNIKIWNQRPPSNDWVCRQTIDNAHEKAIRRVAFSPDGKYLAACSFDATASVYEINEEGEFELLATIEGHDKELKSIAWNPSGTMLATCSRDKTIWIWGMVDKEFDCISVCPGHTQDVKNITWHPTKQILFSSSYDDTIKMWMCDEDDEYGNDEWNCVKTLSGPDAHQSTVWDLVFNPSGTLFCSVGDNSNEFFLWSLDSNTPRRKQIVLSGHRRSIFTVAWSKIDIVATGSGDDSIRLFKLNKDTDLELMVVKEKAHSNDVNCVTWNPANSNVLASCGDDGYIRIWNFSQTV